MIYLILGSCGIIGSALTKHLKSKGHIVLEFDIERDPKEDLRKPNDVLIDLVMHSDFVYFLAYDIGGATYLKNYQNSFKYIHNNIAIMKNTFEVLEKYKKPFLFSSSEMADMRYSAYGCLKAIGEFYCKSLNQPVVKFWNIYGIEHDLNKLHVITDFIKMALTTNRIEMLTDGREKRQMLFVDDACACLEILSEKFKYIPKNQEIHIAGFKWHSIKEIAEEISILSNAPVIPNTKKDLTHQGHRIEPNTYILNFWKPTTSLKNGIKILYEYYTGIFK